MKTYTRTHFTCTLPTELYAALEARGCQEGYGISQIITLLIAPSLGLNPEEYRQTMRKSKQMLKSRFSGIVHDSKIYTYPLDYMALLKNPILADSVYRRLLEPDALWGDNTRIDTNEFGIKVMQSLREKHSIKGV